MSYDNQSRVYDDLYRLTSANRPAPSAGGQLHARGFGVTSKDIERFTRTVQPHRHGVVNAQPPKKPMELMEAQAFIRRLLDAWLLSRDFPDPQL